MKIKDLPIIIILLLYFFLRIYYSQSEHFSDDTSYFTLRQVENIAQTGKPLFHDSLNDRSYAFPPLYYYILAFFYKLSNSVMLLKVINNLFASFSILGGYLLSKKITQDKVISIICGVACSFFPVYITSTLNALNPLSILYPSVFFIFLFFLDLEKGALKRIIPLSVVLCLISPSIFPLLLAMIVFIVLMYVEDKNLHRIYLEYVAFITFFFLWANLIFYKPALEMHGIYTIWSNLPSAIRDNYFRSIDLLTIVTSIGILPFIFGSYSIYYAFFKKKLKGLFIMISLFFSSLSLLFLKLIPVDLGIIFISMALIILFGFGLKELMLYLKDTKFHRLSKTIFMIIILLLLITQILPGYIFFYNVKGYDKDYINALKWIEKNTEKDAVIASAPEDGHLLSYFGKRKSIIDSNYLLIEDIDVRINDIRQIYTQRFKLDAMRIMERYDINYILFSDISKSYYGVENIKYIDECFTPVYNKSVVIYKWERELCPIKNI